MAPTGSPVNVAPGSSIRGSSLPRQFATSQGAIQNAAATTDVNTALLLAQNHLNVAARNGNELAATNSASGAREHQRNAQH